MMRKYLLFITAVAISCSTVVNDEDAVAVVPFPNEIHMGSGVFDVAGASVTYDPAIDEPSVNVIKNFATALSVTSGKESVVSEDGPDKGFVFSLNANLADEAYELDIRKDAVIVEASGLRGFNYAIQTIKQMLPVEIFGKDAAPEAEWTLPCATINDAPRFAYRGLMIDEARHFFGMEEMKRILDIMEVHKLNKLHWHLTDDQGWRIEIKKYPRLTEVGSRRKGTCIKKDYSRLDGVPYGEGMWYTHDQIREIVSYAASKGIDVIPEIDLPGHMLAALSAYPELGCTGGPYEVWTRWGVSNDVLCAGNEKIYTFLEDVLAEICELFPYEYIHIGGDECPKNRWEKCVKCQAKIKELGLEDKDGHKAEHYLQSYVMARMEKFLNEKGRRIIGWDELLEGEVAPNATIMSWRGEEGGLEATRLGHDAIMTPNTYYYLDYYQTKDIAEEPFAIGGFLPVDRCYSYEPYPAGMTDEQKAHILGVQANLWTEYIPSADHLEYMLLPRLAALSEVQWCDADRKNWDRFYASAEHFCDIYDTMGYNYATHILQIDGSVSADVKNRTVCVDLHAYGDSPIRYTLDGSRPDETSSLYEGPLTIDKTCVLNAVTFREGIQPKLFTRRFEFHQAVSADVSFSREPVDEFYMGNPQMLVDGIRGTDVHKTPEWIAWYGAPFDVILDMGQEKPCSSVTVGLFSNKPVHMFLPEHMAVSLSSDGVNYKEVASEFYGAEGKSAPDKVSDITLDFQKSDARFVKLSVTPLKQMPQWHHAAGWRTYVFIDEIIVK